MFELFLPLSTALDSGCLDATRLAITVSGERETVAPLNKFEIKGEACASGKERGCEREREEGRERHEVMSPFHYLSARSSWRRSSSASFGLPYHFHTKSRRICTEL